MNMYVGSYQVTETDDEADTNICCYDKRRSEVEEQKSLHQ